MYNKSAQKSSTITLFVKPEATYASETLFKLNIKSTMDKLQKTEENHMNNYQGPKRWHILPDEVIYRESESLVDRICEKAVTKTVKTVTKSTKWQSLAVALPARLYSG